MFTVCEPGRLALSFSTFFSWLTCNVKIYCLKCFHFSKRWRRKLLNLCGSSNFQSRHLPWNCHDFSHSNMEARTVGHGRKTLTSRSLTGFSSLFRGSREPQGGAWRQGYSQTAGWRSLLCIARKLLKQTILRFGSWIVLKDGFVCFWDLSLSLDFISLEVCGSLNLAAFRAVYFWICFQFFFLS